MTPNMGAVILSSVIDTTLDLRSDAGGKDPDKYSATLRRYHQQLWGKPLPDGRMFALDEQLRHNSELGTYAMSSDAITHSYARRTRPQKLVKTIEQVPVAEIATLYDAGCTIGAYTLFPKAAHVNGTYQPSINQRRGMHPQIQDRFDLTLEAIRLQYIGVVNPLSDVLDRHADFFALFGTFAGYVDHFLLNDLVTSDHESVKFWVDREPFTTDPLPAESPQEYREYARRVRDFIAERNSRISNYP